MAQTFAQKATTDHKELTTAYVSAAVATVLIRYVASVDRPGIPHLILALIAVCGIVGAYLSIARSNASEQLKAGTVIGAAVVSGVCFALVSFLF